MTAINLIELIEEYCKEHNLDVKQVYQEIAETYKSIYGSNIILQMENDGFNQMPQYLESLGTVERYVAILNGYKKMYEKGWK